ncbi:MAG TPA: hypothetical protein VMT58_03085, partial [Candidatus Binataceae bacterium]|nr:hypothetical protein [Candidatus Binataceae bacterium]
MRASLWALLRREGGHRVESIAVLHDESSGANLAFRQSTRFAVSLGQLQAAQQAAQLVQQLREEAARAFSAVMQGGKDYVAAWHKYLDV